MKQRNEQAELSPQEANPNPKPRFNLFELHAREKLGLGEDFEAFSYQILDDDEHMEIKLAVVSGTYRSGPRKGRKKLDRGNAKEPSR